MTAILFDKRLRWFLVLLAFGCGKGASSIAPDKTGDAATNTREADGVRDGSPEAVAQAGDARAGEDRGTAGSSDVALTDAPGAETGTEVLADSATALAVDATGKDANTPADAVAGDSFWSSVVGFCAGKGPVLGRGYCRTVADCGPTGPIVCSIGHYDWGPSACPFPPSSQPCPAECTADRDCTARSGGTCAPYTRACPRCDGRVCQYPPPPCTSSPDSCGTSQRCRTDGTCEVIPCTDGNACSTGYRCNVAAAKADERGCEPIPCSEGSTCSSGRRCNPGSSRANSFGCELIQCDAGYTCPADTRCNVGGPRADSYGCEYVPCGDGYACPENTRCTVAAPPAFDHGCTVMSCKSDGDCDCGYCVNGGCSAHPATCQTPPV